MIEENVVKVGMADLNMAQGTGVLRTTGLGSCVGITLYDPVPKVACMAHIMLPSSEIAKEGNFNLAKYADTAIPEMLRKLKDKGAVLNRLEAKMAGGAQMFAFAAANETMRIGPRNAESCKHLLTQLGIPLKAEDTGGNYGRTIEFDSSTGVLSVRSIQHGVKEM